MTRGLFWIAAPSALLLIGCGSGIDNASSATTAAGGSGGAPTTGGSGGGGATSSASTGGSGVGGSVAGVSCATEPPPGAPQPAAPKAYSGGVCPTMVQGSNTINSMGHDRQFLLAVPSDLQPGEKLPIIFLWHWLGASAESFYDKGEVQTAVDTQRFLGILPQAKGDLLFEWPFESIQTQARMDEEFAFFDDLLACATEQFNTNASCVSSVGVSAGALFTDQLAGARSDYLASFMSLSGGVEGFIKPWAHPPHRLPGLVLWGGMGDICIVINFQQGSLALEQALGQDGNFLVECIHNCGHTEPPFEAPPGLSKYAGLWQFAFDHPFWLGAGQSPYTTDGLPLGVPEWCAIGAGKATERVGECNGGGC